MLDRTSTFLLVKVGPVLDRVGAELDPGFVFDVRHLLCHFSQRLDDGCTGGGFVPLAHGGDGVLFQNPLRFLRGDDAWLSHHRH